MTTAHRQMSLFEAEEGESPIDAREEERAPFLLSWPEPTEPAQLEALNDREGHTHARRYLPAERARSMARGAKSAVDARLRSWVHHPDPQVPAALVRNRTVPPVWEGSALSVRRLVLERALDEAAEAEVVWTPLLDRLAASGRWPYGAQRDGDADAEALPRATEQVERLADWIEDPDRGGGELADLLGFGSELVHRLVARRAPDIDADLFDRLMENAERAPDLAANPALAPELRARLVDWSLARLGIGEEEGIEETPPTRHRRSYWRRRNQARSYERRQATATLEELQQVHGSLDAEVRQALLETVVDHPLLRKSDRKSWRRSGGRQGRVRARQAFDVLMASGEDDLTSEQLCALYDAVRHDSGRVRHLLEHPAVDADVYAHVAEDSSLEKVRTALVNDPEARSVPAVREVLLDSSARTVQKELAEDASPEELREILFSLGRTHPRTALVLMSTQPPPALGEVEELGTLIERALDYTARDDTLAALKALAVVHRETGESASVAWRERFTQLWEEALRVDAKAALDLLIEGELDDLTAGEDERTGRLRMGYHQMLTTEGLSTINRWLGDVDEGWLRRLGDPLSHATLEEPEGSDSQRMTAALRLPLLMADREMRDRIRADGTGWHVADLLDRVPAGEYGETFRALAACDPERALRLIEDAEDGVDLDRLSRADLTPLLQAPNAELRSRAIMLIGQRDGSQGTEPEPARTR